MKKLIFITMLLMSGNSYGQMMTWTNCPNNNCTWYIHPGDTIKIKVSIQGLDDSYTFKLAYYCQISKYDTISVGRIRRMGDTLKVVPQNVGCTVYGDVISLNLGGYADRSIDYVFQPIIKSGLEDEYHSNPANILETRYYTVEGKEMQNPSGFAIKRTLFKDGTYTSGKMYL